jgi:hypothetical protein
VRIDRAFSSGENGSKVEPLQLGRRKEAPR